ncbi:MAG: ABC transporter substrate-binding protein [Bacteroidetes bacterium]|nr:ABC transporter substrate-binding protein [Bacteroidota bacterium]MCY4205759.1 ABC transporter substrate-binding protein [Bacteroidota bacterium]
MNRSCAVLWFVLGVTHMAHVAQAQPIRSVEAEETFQIALDAFEVGEYNDALRAFTYVYEEMPVHIKTTAAYLMAGKSLYRLGDYLASIELLEEFKAQFPSSRYTEEATHLIAIIKQELAHIEVAANTIQIGLALPLSSKEFATTRSMFLGIQLAVNAYNRRNERQIKLVFRDTGNSPDGARSAISSLLNARVSTIIGPLFSDQVEAAARLTESEKIVLIAPLATGGELTKGRRHVFQVNATLRERGRSIAHQAIEYLNLTNMGIVTESGNDVSEEMAQGFIAELNANGLSPAFIYEAESPVDWTRLPQLIGRDTLSIADGIYFSVYHDGERHTSRLIQDGINSIGQAGTRPYILGPSAWHSINLDRLGTRIAAFYVDIHYQNDRRWRAQRFIYDYQEAYGGMQPDLFSYIGYDVAGILLQNLTKEGSLADHLLDAPLYEGLGMRIQFDNDGHNSALYLFEHTPEGPQLIR